MPETLEQGRVVNEYMDMLEEELNSCCQPKVKNVAEASEVELVRDLHRVLTGNGDATHGMIFKVAAANVNIRLLSRDLNSVRSVVDGHTTRFERFRADHDQADALSAAGKYSVRKIGQALWDNKSLLVLVVLSALVYLKTMYPGTDVTQQDAELRIEKLLEQRIEQILLERIPNPRP